MTPAVQRQQSAKSDSIPDEFHDCELWKELTDTLPHINSPLHIYTQMTEEEDRLLSIHVTNTCEEKGDFVSLELACYISITWLL